MGSDWVVRGETRVGSQGREVKNFIRGLKARTESSHKYCGVSVIDTIFHSETYSEEMSFRRAQKDRVSFSI